MSELVRVVLVGSDGVERLIGIYDRESPEAEAALAWAQLSPPATPQSERPADRASDPTSSALYS